MNNKIKEREIPEHKTSLTELVVKFETEQNPVTKSVYRSIIAGRIGLTERNEFIRNSLNVNIRGYLDKCTYSFDGRLRMKKLFELWFMK